MQTQCQPLKQEGCFSVVVCDGGNAFSNLLNQFHGLMIPPTCGFNGNWEKDVSVRELVVFRGLVGCRLLGYRFWLNYCCWAQMGPVLKMFIGTYWVNYTMPRNNVDSFYVNNALAKSYRSAAHA